MQAGSAIGTAARHTIGMVAQALLVVAIIATLAIAAATVVGGGPAGADSVFAAKGGQSVNNGHGGNGGGAASTVTTTISVPDGVFGGTTTATVTGGSTWVRTACSSATGGMVSWTATDSAGNATIQLGPTPSWSSGGASCSATAGDFDTNGNFAAAASTTFSVSG